MPSPTLPLRAVTCAATALATATTIVLGALPSQAVSPIVQPPQATHVTQTVEVAPLPVAPAEQEAQEAQEAPAPVTVLQLTDADGAVTELGGAGLADLDEAGAAAPVAPAAPPAVQGSAPLGASPASLDRFLGLAQPTPAESAPQTVEVLSEPLATDEFFVAGVTWEGEQALPAGTTVYLRVLEGETWTPWQSVEAETLEKDAADITGTEVTMGGGTAPFVAGGATAVQVQVAAADGADVPAGLELNLVPADAEGERVLDAAPEAIVAIDGATSAAAIPDPQDATRSVLDQNREGSAPAEQPGAAPAVGGAVSGGVGSAAPAAATQALPGLLGGPVGTAVSRPAIISRASWGADESKMTWTPRRAPVVAAVVHHTAGSNNYSSAQSASVVRGIYTYHAVTRGWGDVGYNFLFDKYGRIYEGRAGSLNSPAGQMVTGAHASNYNTGTVGVSAMGDYTSVYAPQSILDNMAKVIAWQFSGAGIDATGRSGIIAPGTNFTARGTNLPRIFGHRDVADVTRTTCPGPNIGARLGAMRTAVSTMTKGATTPPKTSTAVTPPAPAPDPRYATWFLNNNFDSSSDLQFQYGLASDTRLVGDWDGDGKDTVAIRRGNVYHFINSHAGGVADLTVDFGRVADQVYVGDWNGDGKDTLAVRRGNVFHVQNSLRGGKAEVEIAYGQPADEVLVGDWNGDRRDTFAVRRGNAFHIRNTMTSGVAEQLAYYGQSGDAAFAGDWNGDGRDTIGVRRGTTYHLRNVIAGGDADVTVAYGRETDEHIVGDWDGNGTDTLGLRRVTP